jgi:SAM-dependent methyltransferase
MRAKQQKKTEKTYDRAYFQRWYHNRRTRVNTSGEVRRKVSLAAAVAEYFLRRPIRNVLDIGCGEGAWLGHLRALRPRVRYTGLDSSDYAVARYGRERNIRKASFGQLPSLDLGPHDLVVCADVLHYVSDDEIRAGVAAIARACDGIAYLEVLTSEDEVIGDLDAFHHRPAAWYRSLFRKAGLTQVAPYCWLSPSLREALAELEA